MIKSNSISSDSGIYLLEIETKSSLSIKIKKFENITLSPGFYYYAGSAQKNLRRRLERHQKKEKTVYWHIDHLTAHNSCRLKRILIFRGRSKSFECGLVAILLGMNLKINLKGFGNGDCNRCESHLLYSSKKIDYSHFISRYQAIAL